MRDQRSPAATSKFRPFGADPRVEALIDDKGWPTQRLRLGYGLVLFAAFEVTVGRQLPGAMTALLFGSGLALLMSAGSAIRRWRLRSQVAILRAALDAGPSSAAS